MELSNIREMLDEKVPGFISYYGIVVANGYVYVGVQARYSPIQAHGCIRQYNLSDVLDKLPADIGEKLVDGLVLKRGIVFEETRAIIKQSKIASRQVAEASIR